MCKTCLNTFPLFYSNLNTVVLTLPPALSVILLHSTLINSSVGIVTGYGLDGLGIESRWGRDFSAPVQTGPAVHPASCTMGTGAFPGVKCGRGVTLSPHPFLVPLVMKDKSYISTPPMGRTVCTEPQCLYKGALYLIHL